METIRKLLYRDETILKTSMKPLLLAVKICWGKPDTL